MAQLTSAQKDELNATLMRFFSSTWTEVPLTKAQLRNGIDVFDAGLETAESSILSNVNQGQRDWLLDNQTLARYILEEVAKTRREEL